MSTQTWPSLADPRQLVQIGLARVRVGESLPGAERASPLTWQQRTEDALRCASLGDAQRLVLIRKLQVRTGSALAPGWAQVVEAAAQDAVSRARPGRSAGAECADAVWFESWDDAVAAWLDVALAVGSPELQASAWYWPRIARMAGLPVQFAGSASGGASPGFGSMSTRDEHARTMWARWQADPVSQRACKAWSAQRPGVLSRLRARPEAPDVQPQDLADQPTPAADAAHSPLALQVTPVPGLVTDDAHPPGLEPQYRARTEKAGGHALAPQAPVPHEPAARPEWGQGTPEAPEDHEGQGGSNAASAPVPSSVSDGQGGHALSGPWASPQSAASLTASQRRAQAQPQGHGDRHQASSDEARLKPDRIDTAEPQGHSPQSLSAPGGESEALAPAFRALGWTHLRFTQLGGLPFTLRALQGLGFAQALSQRVREQEGVDAHMAASAPWLYLWARLGPHARQQWVRDPMFAVLPAFERVAGLPVQDHAQVLWACWMDQPASVRSLGQQAWGRLHRAMRHKGWRSAVQLLQGPAWMQLSHTHLDVLFTLDQADLNVRRQGLDADPGWVPWLGRIVSLHFEPAQALPPYPLDRSTP